MSLPVLTKEVLTGRCQDCQKYLSVSPIMMIGNRPLCGRCVEKIPNAPGTIAEFYEEIAKFMNFPCSYDIYGCEERLGWNVAWNHERVCEYAPLLCPAIGCEYKLRKMDVLKHFCSCHQNLIIIGDGFEIPNKEQEEVRVNKIFVFKDKLLILKLRFEHEITFINITSLNDPETFICIFQLTDEKIYYQHTIQPYCDKFDIDDVTMEDDRFCKIRCKNEAFCNVSLSTNSFLGLEFYKKNVLSEIDCPVCFDCTRPPLISCLNGHIICSRCYRKLKGSACPLCRKALAISQHIVLNKVFEKLIFPCIYEGLGCTAFGCPKEISLHESQCHYFYDDSLECYLKTDTSCSWIGPFSYLAKHMFLQHTDSFVLTGKPIKTLLSDLRHKICYTEFNKDMFTINLNYERKFGLSLKIRINSRLLHHQMYQYYVEFSNNSDHHVSPRTDIINEPIEFNLVINSLKIKPFLKGNELKFTIHIIKL